MFQIYNLEIMSVAKELGKIPPHSQEAEQSVLGSVLLDKEAIIKIADVIKVDDFYFESHQNIYQAMLELYHKRQPIDLLTLSNLLEDQKLLDQIGGGAYLAEITNVVPTASHVVEYAFIVKNKSTLRKLLRSGQEITALGYEENTEINNLLEKAEKSLFKVTQTFLKDKFVHIKDILNKRFEIFAELHMSEEKEAIRGVPTGIGSLDHKLSGLQPSDLVILAARPSMGKTALALTLAQNSAFKYKKTVGIFSLEMSKEQLVDRMFCSMLGVDSWKLQKGELDDEDFSRMGTVMDELSRAKIFIDDSAGANIVELRAKARRLQMEHGLDFIIIDYLQLMQGNNPLNRVQEISEISRALKGLARELHVPILALSQLSRAVENRPGKIPQLSDLRESGSIEQDADVVLMLFREDYYEENSDRPGVTDLFIRKHRNGPVGKVELMFQKEKMRFTDIDKSRLPDM